ncbi:N-acetylneuraminate synthase [Vampirovibrio chlorellavorus]|uniref:N-acetylneuraminate synthase n=1 Tax=Vampirovibrio chlorellavorus TaxID=758823 RepID=UPI0026EFF5E3|nr:N-acetylneuraminate synthase [Vampirovibrio chlorellavorus]
MKPFSASPFSSKTQGTFIIAEAGVNHNGDLAMARALIDGAAQAGADAVKFQMFEPALLASAATPLAAYQEAGEANGNRPLKTQIDLLEALALPKADFLALQAYAEQAGIQFLCTPFDDASAVFLHETMGLPLLKISSGELTNLPFLRFLGEMNTPLILSTGMATLAEVEAAVQAVWQKHRPSLALLHCVSAYPAAAETINLRAMRTLQKAFPDCAIGYSDHTLGIHIPVAAVALGAGIIEKHFTLDKTLPGPDHKASLSLEELTDMVRAIRETEAALGDGIKQPNPIEADCIRVARKSLVARHALPADHRLTLEDLMAKRPGTGISPADLHLVLGRRLKRAIAQDELLQPQMLES